MLLPRPRLQGRRPTPTPGGDPPNPAHSTLKWYGRNPRGNIIVAAEDKMPASMSQLTKRERIALFHISTVATGAEYLHQVPVWRLHLLHLIEEVDGFLKLTPLGEDVLRSLPPERKHPRE